MRQTRWWMISAVVSVLLAIGLVNQWRIMNNYEVKPPDLATEASIENYLKVEFPQLADNRGKNVEPMRKVRTGILIQSLKFFNSTEFYVSGYIWQRYAATQRDIRPGKDEIGFILPEQVNSGSDIAPREIYRIVDGSDEVIGWHFEATLRQPFDYSSYPFDHKTAWVRIWHREFWRNIVLVPDFKGYQDLDQEREYERNCPAKLALEHYLDPNCTFGVDEQIVLGAWEGQMTYFDYFPSKHDTNFGTTDNVRQYTFPDLRHNYVLKRKFENAFIIYLLPLFLVAMLLFAALLTVSDEAELSGRFGFSTSGFIGACSALFFVVLLAHIQLRQQFSGSPIVYIEYFYILMYVLLVVSTVNVYLFSVRPKSGCGWILYRDNIIFKVSYWPVVLGCLILITLGFS